MQKPITNAICETWECLSNAIAALNTKMELEPETNKKVDSAFVGLRQARRDLVRSLGYDDYGEFLETIWRYEQKHPK